MRALLVAFLLVLALAPAARADVPPIKHVFVVVLENKNFDETFGPASQAPYLAKTLTARGQLLRQYYGTGHESLDNYISMISGQAPNPVTQADCTVGFNNVTPGTMVEDGQALGMGCVYPAAVKTLADQLEGAGKSWKGYMEDMSTPCQHPAIGSPDTNQSATAASQYATRHNPFVYFHSIIDDQARCDAHVVSLNQLQGDLASASKTPNFSFITPDLCSDGHDATCADGGKGGYAGIDQFLSTWTPRILNSPAYADGGMLIVAFDESEDGAEACCNEPTGPNTPQPGIQGPGGGRTGAVVVSPYVEPGSTNDSAYNHYSLLRSLEDLFGLQHLGYAGMAGLRPFGSDVYNAKSQPTPGSPTAKTHKAKKKKHKRKKHKRKKHRKHKRHSRR
jgi:phosphatidylinositol-3-phosphatase